jgi:hypothetical protein
MQAFVAAGGQLDRVEFDYEGGLSTWSMNAANLRAIIADPRSASLEADMAPWHLADALWHQPARLRFNALMARNIARAMQEAEFGVVKRHFPDATGSNYSNTVMTEAQVAPDLNGHDQYGYEIVGTHNTWPFYGWMNQLQNWLQPGVTEPYGAQPMSVLRWHVKVARSMRRSAPDIPIRPWIGFKAWVQDTVGPIHLGNTPYYDELIYHLALTGADDFLYFRPSGRYGNASVSDDIVLASLLDELDLRGVSRACTPVSLEELPWNASVVASGMQTGAGAVLWRITVPEGEDEVHVIRDATVIATLQVAPGKAGAWYTSAPGDVVRFALPGEALGNLPPTVMVHAPMTSSPNGNVNPVPYAEASDPDGSIHAVSFFYTNELSGYVRFAPQEQWQLYHTLPLAGPYQLVAVAEDDQGATTISDPVTVEILASPPSLSTDNLQTGADGSLSAQDAIIRVNGTTPIFRGFEYGTTTAYGQRVVSEGLYGPGTFTLNIEALQPNTTYHVRACASNAAGIGYGQDMQITTPPGPNFPPEIVSPPTATPQPALTGTPVDFLVAAVDDDGDALHYTWEFGDGTVSTPQPAAGMAHTYTASGDYTVTVAVTDGRGGNATASLTVTIVDRFPGDLNGDGTVNVNDLTLVVAHFGRTQTDRSFDGRADANADGLVNVDDLTEVTAHFGEVHP